MRSLMSNTESTSITTSCLGLKNQSVLGSTFVCILFSCPKSLFVYFKMVDHNISFSDPSKSNHSISEMFLVFV